jgi:phosphatidylglycerophosphate synthase
MELQRNKTAQITDAVLWVSHPGMMLERLAGMTLLERQLFTLQRAGIRRVWISAQFSAEIQHKRLRWPEGLETIWVSSGDAPNTACQPPYVGISADHLIQVETLKSILAMPHLKQIAYQDEHGRGVIQIIPYRTDIASEYERQPMPKNSCLLMQKPPDKSPALPWLLKQARKSQDGFMARHFDRHISLAITRLFLNTPLHPNHVTILSSCVGLAGAGLFLMGTYPASVLGSLTLWLHTVLDGCDGEIARLRFQESLSGGMLDFWGDNLVHATLFSCMALGIYQKESQSAYLALGASAVISVIASALLLFRHATQQAAHRNQSPFFIGLPVEPAASNKLPGTNSIPRIVGVIENILTQRDFIYLLVLLSLIDRVKEFLWAAGVGSPLFLMALLYLLRRSPQLDGSRVGRI